MKRKVKCSWCSREEEFDFSEAEIKMLEDGAEEGWVCAKCMHSDPDYLKCWLCGKEERITSMERMKAMGWAEMTIKHRDFEDKGWICGKCYMNLIKKHRINLLNLMKK